jgi:uncharacterized protein (DUF1684 family)
VSEADSWQQWRNRREESLRQPHGPLALIGTHWLGDEPAPIIEGEPVHWSAGADRKSVVLTAKAEHGIVFDGEPVDGTVTLRTDSAEHPDTAIVPELDILLVPIERDGSIALRVYDPNSPQLVAFGGIDAFDYDAHWAVPATYTPYAGPRVEKVVNADGVVHGLGLDGTIAFELEDGRHTLEAALSDGGGLWIVFSDPTTAESTPSFRFLDTSAPDPETGSLTLDFNRAYLPPCAFTDHYVCPVPPHGNKLASPVRAGELAAKTR